MHPYRIGSLAGLIGATVFALSYRSGMPEPWPLLAVVGWLAAVALYVWAGWLRPVTQLPEGHPPRRHAGLIYLASVVGMLVLIFGSRLVLADLGREELVPPAIAVAVALHFLPFAHAFRAPVFTALGWLMTAVGLVGLVLGWVLDSGAVASGAAVLAGLLMLVVISLGALRRA